MHSLTHTHSYTHTHTHTHAYTHTYPPDVCSRLPTSVRCKRREYASNSHRISCFVLPPRTSRIFASHLHVFITFREQGKLDAHVSCGAMLWKRLPSRLQEETTNKQKTKETQQYTTQEPCSNRGWYDVSPYLYPQISSTWSNHRRW